MLSMQSRPSAYIPPGAVRDPSSVAGRVLLANVSQGQVVTFSLLAPKGGPVGSLVPAGLRAVAVPSSLPPGAVASGDRVDVLATFPGAHAHVETVASGLEVLRALSAGTGSGTGGDVASPGTGTTLLLLVSPDQAEQLAYARAFAAVSIALDGPQEVVPGT